MTTKEGGLYLCTRKVTPMNYSHVVALPKIFVENYLSDNREVRITMYEGKLTLEPVPYKDSIEYKNSGQDKEYMENRRRRK